MPVDGFMGGYVDTSKALTDIANSQLIGQMNAFKLQTDIKNQTILDKARASMIQNAPQWADLMMGGGGMVPPPALGTFNPGVPPPPTPGQMAASENSDTPITSNDVKVPGQPAPPQGGPLKDPLTDTEATRTLGMLSMSYRSAIADGYSLRAAGDIQGAETASARAVTVQKDLIAAQNEVRKERKEARTSIATALSNVTDGSTLNNMMNTLEDQYPGLKNYLGQKLIRNPDGSFAWDGTANPAAVKAMGDSIRTIAEQDAKEDHSIQRQQSAERAAEVAREDRARDEDRRVNQQIAREGQEIRREVAQATIEYRRDQQDRRIINDTQAQLNKNPVYQNYPKFQNAQAYADQIVAKLNTPGGYLNVTPSDMAALKKMYADASYSFRPRTGGKYDSVEAASFNGFWQKLDKTLTSVGTGQMTWNETTARDVVNTVSQLSYNANKAAVLASFKAADAARKRGVTNLSGIQVRGDLGALQRAGDLTVTNEGGKDYFVIKNGKDAPYKFLDPDTQ